MSDQGLSVPSATRGYVEEHSSNPNLVPSKPSKRKRNLPGNPDPDAEVVALSPKSLMATNRFMCDICNKGFQREQNLQLHRRGHNLPWKLKQKTNKEAVRKKVYVCPEKSCVHHHPSRALGDLTGVKKHYSRKHGEKKWKCDRCSKKYAVQSDWKAHSKICGTREYRCDCGTLFSRKDSFITHKALCDVLIEDGTRFTSVPTGANYGSLRNEFFNGRINPQMSHAPFQAARLGSSEMLGNFVDVDGHHKPRLPLWLDNGNSNYLLNQNLVGAVADDNINSNAFTSSGGNGTSLPDLVQAMSMFGSSSQSMPWANRYQDAICYANLNDPSMSAVPHGVKEEQEENKANLSASIASIYSNSKNTQSLQHDQNQMSATAVLQKATQMGSAGCNEAAFNTNCVFGLVGTNLSSYMSAGLNFCDGSSNVSHEEAKIKCQGQANHVAGNLKDKFNSLASLTSSNNTFNMGDGSSLNDSNSGTLLSGIAKRFDHFAMPDANVMQRRQSAFMAQHPRLKEYETSLTRDFLGVGGDHSVNNLAKFPAMDLSHYGGHH